jgi:hypothetical protein
MVEVTRSHVLAGRTFGSVAEMQAAWEAWLPTRRSQVHRTHGEVIAVRAERDRAALLAVPASPYVVCERHIRTVGKDALVHFDASVYSVPWRLVRPRQKVELRVDRDSVAVWTLGGDARQLAVHDRARAKGSWVVDPTHWDGLPGHTHAHAGPTTATVDASPQPEPPRSWTRVEVARRPLADYDLICHERGGGV